MLEETYLYRYKTDKGKNRVSFMTWGFGSLAKEVCLPHPPQKPSDVYLV